MKSSAFSSIWRKHSLISASDTWMCTKLSKIDWKFSKVAASSKAEKYWLSPAYLERRFAHHVERVQVDEGVPVQDFEVVAVLVRRPLLCA